MRANRIAVSIVAGLALGLSATAATAQQTVRIGAVCHLTGPAAPFGKSYCDGFDAYVKVWNERGGFKGRKVELIKLDDETNPVNAVNAYRRHAADSSIQMVWSGVGSNSALPIKAIASEVKVPVIAGGGADAIGLPANPYVFKVATGTTDFAIALVEWAAKQGAKSIATLTANDAYGQSDASGVRTVAPKFGMKVVAQESFSVTDTNFNTQWVRIRAANPDIIYNGATGRAAILSFQQYRQLQLPFPLSLSQAAFNRAFFDAIGGPGAAEGLYSATNQGSLGDALSGEAGAEFKKLSAAVGRPAILWEAFGWDHGIAGEWAMNHSDGTREGIRAALDTIKDLPSINGPITYRPDNHIGHDVRGLKMVVYKGGKFVLATTLSK